MTSALDTNIPSALLGNEPVSSLVIPYLEDARIRGSLVLSPVAYAELLAFPNAPQSAIESFLSQSSILVDYELNEAVWTEAGKRYAQYAARRRKSGGRAPKRLLADFIVGAHALMKADRFITLDPKRYRTDFPELEHRMIVPELSPLG